MNGKTVRKVTLEVEEVDRGGARRDRSHVDVQRAEHGTDSARQGRRHFEITLINNGTMGLAGLHAGMVSPITR